ncbi:MAG TPA: hypothetical protein VGO59_11515 [Verrucomicrobiae bacterium]|jgi:hypothetical protein
MRPWLVSNGKFLGYWLAAFCVALRVPAEPVQTAAELSGQAAAQQTYDSAKARYQTNANDSAADRQFASACFDLADAITDKSVRAGLAREGIESCQKWVRRKPNEAAAHYYLGMNLAQLARTKDLGALPIVKEIEKEWLAADSLDPHCDYAGADRNLGLLYRDTPGFPISIGSHSKARRLLRRAVELDPEYPENHLNLIETDLKRKSSAAPGEYQRLRAILPTARKQFAGPAWKTYWEDWDARLTKIQARLSASP